GVSVVPGTDGPVSESLSDDEVAAVAAKIGYPLMVKAVAAAGGKGMRMAASRDDLASAVRTARSEARTAFGDAAIYFERRLMKPRHIEIQVLGDEHGTV